MKRRLWIMVVVGGMVGLPLICCGLGLLLTGETFLTTGVDAFFGQINLTRGSGPTEARAYVSNELLLGRVRLSEVVEASLIPLPQEVYFWDPAYVGFARADLTGEEALQLLESMMSGYLFTCPYGRQVVCAQRIAGAEVELAACEEGPQWQAIHLYSANGLLAYSAVEVNQVPVERYLAASGDALQSIAVRAVVEPVRILWPRQTSDEANARAARLLGKRYPRALAFLRDHQPLRQIVGGIVEIRPAEGENRSSTWMESGDVQLTMRVTGERGEAVVMMMIRGSDCWDAEMMHLGRWHDLTSGFVCPDA